MSLINSIHPGDRVTIVDRFGKRRTGRAVMRGTYGWVLNMGGPHGTPGIADHDNVVDVKSKTGKAKYNPGKRVKGMIGKSGPQCLCGSKDLEISTDPTIYPDGPGEGKGLHSVKCRKCKKRFMAASWLVQGKKYPPWLKHENPPKDHIVYERGWCTVVVDRGLYTVIKNTTTYGYPDSSYKKDSDGLSIAKARCDYLFKTHGSGPFSGLRRSTSMRRDGKNPGWKKCTISRSGSAYVVIDQHQRRRSFKRHAAALKYAKKISSNPRRRKISRRRKFACLKRKRRSHKKVSSNRRKRRYSRR